MISSIVESILIRECQIKDQLSQVIDVDSGNAIRSSSVNSQRLFLFKRLFEKRKKDIFAHAINQTTVDDAAIDSRIQVIYAQSQVLQLLHRTRNRNSLQIVLFSPVLSTTATAPVKHRWNNYQLLRRWAIEALKVCITFVLHLSRYSSYCVLAALRGKRMISLCNMAAFRRGRCSACIKFAILQWARWVQVRWSSVEPGRWCRGWYWDWLLSRGRCGNTRPICVPAGHSHCKWEFCAGRAARLAGYTLTMPYQLQK